MKADRYEGWSGERRRLSRFIIRRGTQIGFSPLVGILFGCPFVGIGVCLLLVSANVIAVDPSSLHAPHWVLACAGLSFCLAGLLVWGGTSNQLLAKWRRQRLLREHPAEPALADYQWSKEGVEASNWGGAARALAWAVGLTIFLSMFNWWAFYADKGWFLKIFVGIFDCIALFMWWQAARQISCGIKFGSSRVAFARFPYRLGEPVVLRWQAPTGITRVTSGKFILCCVEEWVETTGTGRNRRSTLVHEEMWSSTWLLEQARNLQLKETFELTYELPADARPSDFAAERPVFWELVVRLDIPGLDFSQTYLVPIYSSKPKPVVLKES